MAALAPDSSVAEKQNLLERLLDAVKQCQVRFGGKAEIAPDSDPTVVCLCQQLEAVLQHGLKRGNTRISTTILKMGTSQKQDGPVFWQLLKEVLSKSEIDRFNSLNNISTDAGRGRAWLRAALNEHSLQHYIEEIQSNQLLLKSHYENFAYLLDTERSAMLPQMAAGLSTIVFAINIDNPDLNSAPRATSATGPDRPSPSPNNPGWSQKNIPEAVVAPEAKEILVVQKKKKKRSKAANTATTSSHLDDTSARDQRSAAAPISVNKKSTSPSASPYASQGSSPSDEPQRSSATNPTGAAAMAATTTTTTTTHRRNRSFGGGTTTGLDPVAEVQIDQESLNAPPLRGSSFSGRSRSAAFMASQSSNSVTSETRAAFKALQVCHQAQKTLESNYRPGPDTSEITPPQQEVESPAAVSPPPSLGSSDSMTKEELKQAILAMVQRKDEAEAQNRSFRSQITAAEAEITKLNTDLAETKAISAVTEEELKAKVSSLCRENELLKHQLKRYVGVVQTIRRERSESLPKETLEAVSMVPSMPPAASEASRFRADSISEAEHYEKKLVQVTEMHGELMEFNEKLHIQLLRRETQLKRLRRQLAYYKGVPLEDDDEISGRARNDSLASTKSLTSSRRQSLVNVWIPSAFLNGRGADVHHVYQIFVRIRDDEWNVYRRYAQFRELFAQACEFLPTLKSFQFPPKKTLGNKDERFVETRRKKLQEFLRFLFDIVTVGGEGIDGTALDLKTKPTKKALIKAIPFFSDANMERPDGPPVTSLEYNGL
ncbi:sorting nexin-29-like [Oscarella lobularis]|uniref:sorting nexin-29-like n=1 Tax=Oscarella lobularis TaxID=121494 RepID=UPI003313F537